MDSISPYGDDKFNLISVWLGPQHAGGTKETFLGYMHVEEPLRREDGFSAPVSVALRRGLLAHRFTEHLPQVGARGRCL